MVGWTRGGTTAVVVGGSDGEREGWGDGLFVRS